MAISFLWQAWSLDILFVAVFNGLVRSADGIGIPLDDTMLAATADARSVLGLDSFAGAANNPG